MHHKLSQRARGRSIPFVLAIVTGCASAPTPAPVPAAGAPARPTTAAPASPRPALDPAAVTNEMVDRTNAARRAAGLPGLGRSVNLMQAAQLQADQMVKAGRMDHELAGQPYPTLKARLAAVQYNVRAAGENIAEGQHTAAEVVSTWMDSSHHRANMLSKDYTELGAGVAAARNGRLYFVQVFGRPARTSASTQQRPTG
jgi:uncharacterized protein YkwD